MQRALDAGLLTGDAAGISLFMWAVSHGYLSLEIAGKLMLDSSEAELAYRDALIFSALPFLASAPRVRGE